MEVTGEKSWLELFAFISLCTEHNRVRRGAAACVELVSLLYQRRIQPVVLFLIDLDSCEKLASSAPLML